MRSEMLKFFRCFALVLFLVLPAAVSAQSDLGGSDDDWIGITGLVIDNSVTKPGRDFYETFNKYFTPVKGAQYTIYIEERPDFFRGGTLWVKVDEDTIFNLRLTPRTAEVEEAAKKAAIKAQKFLIRRLLVKNELELY